MLAFWNQMIEQIISCEILLAYSYLLVSIPQRPNLFEQPPLRQILRFEKGICELQTKFTEKEIELNEVKRSSANLFDVIIMKI